MIMCSMKKFSSKSFVAYELDWDTDFFEVPSARAILKDDVLVEDRLALKEYIDKFEFVTITNVNNNAYNNIWLGKETTAFLCDMNIQFIKDVNWALLSSKEVGEVYEAYSCEKKRIIEIAKSAFSYSRFLNDPRLSKEKARNIYAHWVESAFNRPDRYFAISRKNGFISGFLLFSIDNKDTCSNIELIAVDEAYRGLKVGKTLVNTMQIFLHRKGIDKIKVGTQVDNVLAIRFYTTNGFQYINCNSVYHYWPKINCD